MVEAWILSPLANSGSGNHPVPHQLLQSSRQAAGGAPGAETFCRRLCLQNCPSPPRASPLPSLAHTVQGPVLSSCGQQTTVPWGSIHTQNSHSLDRAGTPHLSLLPICQSGGHFLRERQLQEPLGCAGTGRCPHHPHSAYLTCKMTQSGPFSHGTGQGCPLRDSNGHWRMLGSD